MKSRQISIFWPTTLYGQCWLLWFLFGGAVIKVSVLGEVLTPPYFNLAENRRITATATCGDEGPELYCKLVGANSETDSVVNNIIHGQVCDYCDMNSPAQSHPPQYAIDGSERWWQSPPLSRGTKYNEVNLTIDLGQEFHVAYVLITMANSPRPGVWALERSTDNGETWKPWQYFAENPADCEKFFRTTLQQIHRDESVICETSFSKVVPLESGEIVVSLLNQRPSASDFFSSDVLQEWTRATNIRLRLLRTTTLKGQLMSVVHGDSTVTRRYFYSIKDISIGGRCRCNGHADLCDITDPYDTYKLLCRCQHNTCGAQCEKCCPGFVQKAWRPATYSGPFSCEPCNCHGHSSECYYDEEVDNNGTSLDVNGRYEGGGVCLNCLDNTEGTNCDKCIPGYFRPFGKDLRARDVCQPCQCNDFFATGNCAEGSGRCECKKEFKEPNCDECSQGYYNYPECKPCDCYIEATIGEVCEVGGGQCPCKRNFAGTNCDKCAEGYYNFPDCLPCDCDEPGSLQLTCDANGGQCECNNMFGGRRCDQCENGYFDFPSCAYCNCDVRGTREGICDKSSGNCLCREGYGSDRCDQCLPEYYGYPDCKPCNCSATGSIGKICDASGNCPCLHNFSGRTCDQCKPGFYLFPECLPCTCSSEGSMGVSCDDEGKCQCKKNFDGLQCERCGEGFYNHPRCEECNCHPAGVTETFRTCADAPKGTLCVCKERVNGSICNECKPLFWNLQQWNPRGCDECDCYTPGVIGGVQVCDGESGQCPCKSRVATRQCEFCQDGFYNLTSENIFGCIDCGCDVGGAVNTVCDKTTGQCTCRPRIEGTQCTQPLQTHFYPTLYQFQYEAEDGKTPSRGDVRFGYDGNIFPDFSWRGYAIFNALQPETIYDIYIDKSSLYRFVLRYVNPGEMPVPVEIKAIPDNPSDEDQSAKMKLEPKGKFATVSRNNLPQPFVLNPGRWHFHILSDQYLLIDYFVLLPAAYYEGSILQKQVNEPCMLNTTSRVKGNNIIPDPCVKLKYPSIDKYDTAMLSDGYVDDEGDRVPLSQFYKEKKVLKSLGLNTDRLAVLSPQQREIDLDFPASKGGRYMLLLEYFTPMGANVTTLELEATSMKGTHNGQILIHNCKLATACRQVVTTEDGEVAVFKFEKNNINLVVKAPDNVTDKIALHSITAVPYGKWSLDHIRPEEYCVIRNGTCVPSTYEHPPDSTKVEAEANDPERVAGDDEMPEGVMDKNLVYLHGPQRNLTISGKVPAPGAYTLMVHYYQPENPGFSLGVEVQNGQYYEAKLPVVHCPSTVGCRAIITQDSDDKNQHFYIRDDFKIILNSPQNIWVDYVLAVPSNQNELTMIMDADNDKYLHPSQLDETSKFFAECGKNHFHLPSNTSDFCKAATFSLTSEYNNGALPCQCQIPGATSFECEPYGGQCTCKENVIGRRCERCKTGFFGYPNCKTCDCPASALCDDQTGECVCAPRVSGAKCDSCSPLTYGFDAMIGCLECDCHPPGVVNGNLQCDLQDGQCECKPNIVGRTCDKCKPGHWAMPYCQLCDCDMRGTTDEICNQDTSQCYCKVNVEGRGCDTCKVGSFNLQESNPGGCTKCFCFGKTTRCNSAYLFWTQETAVKEQWTGISFDPIKPYSPVIGYEIEFEDLGQDAAFVPLYIPEDTTPEGNETNVLYFKADINSNHLASYGGHISYTLVSDPDSDEERATYTGADVILEGRELSPSASIIRLLHYAVEHLDEDNAMRMKLALLEENFVILSATGGLVTPTREQMMIVLKDLKAIYVRAGYWKRTREAKLSDFGIEMGTEDHVYPTPDNRALTIEQCQCPPNYQGLSCEECAQGYFRSPTGPHGGYCVPCQCNGHSDTCDPVSGICNQCRHNTTGDHCEMCQVGYHGDATHGTPYDCLICACPLPTMSNNFATSCEFSYDGSEISCECKEGYFGNRCEGCAPGHFGVPEIQGDYCKPCSCSGNIDVMDPYACDTVTGRCLKCLNDTSGELCEYCRPGFYGDAVIMKSCNKCSCNECGTHECDHTTGECQCRHNVIGVNCDLCAPDHYGLSVCDGVGCYPCDCSIAAVHSQCDDATGQCECRSGTTGRRCERCAPGYWNYGPDGCQPCECNQDYAIGVGCNPETGQCSCLPGVVGEKCDRCPWRWVLIEDRGCQECDTCQHQLLDDTDAMDNELTPVKDEFDSVALSYFTTQKLAYFNDTAAKLEPDVRLLDPARVDLSPYYSSVNSLETDVALSRQKGEVTEDSLKDKAKQSLKLKEKSFEMESQVQEAVAKAQTAVYETKDLMEGLMADDRLVTSPQTDAARAEADFLIDSMQNVRFDPSNAEAENKTAGEQLRHVEEFVKPIKALSKELGEKSEKLMNVRDKLKDLRNQSDYSFDTSRRANEIMDKIKEAKFPVKLEVLENRANEMLDNIATAASTNILTENLINDLDDSYIALTTTLSSVNELGTPLIQKSETLANELENHHNTIDLSRQHAAKLQREADRLDRMLEDTRAASENAVSAATAYKNIVDALSEALNAADMAKSSAENATLISDGIGSEALGAIEPSRNLRILAEEKEVQVDQGLKLPLEDAKSSIELIEKMNSDTVENLGSINNDLTELERKGDLGGIEEAIRVSTQATEKATLIQADVDDIINNLPDQKNSARKLHVTVNDLNQRVDISDNQLNQAKDDIPLSTAITGSLEAKKPMFEEKRTDLAARLADLKAKIAAAREQANRVPVGMNLQESSALLLANPEGLESQQAETKVSLHFRTNEQDGLLLYLGNEPGRKEDDFMSIEIERGYPVLTMDLGSGPQRITNDKKYVADDQWYKATVNRDGKLVRFTISEEDNYGNVVETAEEGYLGGSKSLFNVNKNSSRLYVGGLPPGHARSPVKFSTYRGVIEDLQIGEEKVGLWNFKDAQNLNPAYERDKLVNLKVETGLRFLGNGYAILNRTQYSFRRRSAIQLKFQTRAKSGLMFLVGRGRKYLSIEINNGAVAFQYDLGGGPARLITMETYNDGNWHTVDAVRDGARSALSVDGERKASGQSTGGQTTLSVSEYMYFGGYPGDHGFLDVTNRGFEGCIKDVLIENHQVFLSASVEARYTLLGCPSSGFEPSVASFFGQGGFIQVPSEASPVIGPEVVTQDDTIEVSLRVRTNSSDGLILYGANHDQSNYLSVSLFGGALRIKSEPGPSEILTDIINDANWHAITISRDKRNLLVSIDDMHDYREIASGGPVNLKTPGSMLFLGGHPEDFQPRDDSTASSQSYLGCVADISINGKRMNFADAQVSESSLSQKCLTLEDKMLEQVETDKNGRTIPKTDDSDEDEVIFERTTPSTTTTTMHPHHPPPEPEVVTEDDFDSEEELPEKKPTKLPEPPPTPFMQCALPYRTAPSDDEDVSMDEGVRFGNLDKTSRIEYYQQGDDGLRSTYSIDFKSSSPDGVIFMWTEFDKSDFVALYLRKGYLHYAFDSGAGPAYLNTTKMYNDSDWHTASFTRYKISGVLTVDGSDVVTGNSSGTTTNVNAGTTVYVGGLPAEAWSKRMTFKKLQNVDTPFRGCLRNFMLRNKAPGAPLVQHSVQPCTSDVENGFYFYPNSGYLKLHDNFKVGRNIKLSMNIKPRHPSGILLAVHADKDFMVLQMINGTIKFIVDNGKGPVSSSFTKEPYDLCDGNWHSIRVTKSKNVVTLALDNTYSHPGIGVAGKDSTNTRHPLYLGGIPPPTTRLRGLETMEQYVGCIKDFVIEDRQFKFNHDIIQGTVALHSCPTD